VIENIFQLPVLFQKQILALSGIEEMAEAAKTVTTLQHAVYSNTEGEDELQHQYLFEILGNKAIRAENRTS
jgi:hypothetical protein